MLLLAPRDERLHVHLHRPPLLGWTKLLYPDGEKACCLFWVSPQTPGGQLGYFADVVVVIVCRCHMLSASQMGVIYNIDMNVTLLC